MAYTHLTEDERYHIYELHVEKHGVSSIAEQVGRDKSTISRELRRNRGERGYRPGQATRLSRERSLVSAANGRRIDEAVWAAAQSRLQEDDWSPEQIAGRFRRDGTGEISHETIYQRVYADKATGGTLHRHLRCKKQRRKRYGGGRSR